MRLRRWPTLPLLLPLAALLHLLPVAALSRDLDLQRFHPLGLPDGGMGVQASRVLPHLHWHAGLLADAALDELVETGADGTHASPLDWRVRTVFQAALGLAGRLDLSLALPVYAWQHSEGSLAVPDGAGLGDLRVGLRVGLLQGPRYGGFGLALAADLSLPTARRGRLMGERLPTGAPRLVADWRHPKGWWVGVNLGYRMRQRVVLADRELGHEVLAGVGAAAPLGIRGLSALLEVDAAVAAVSPADGLRSPVEIRGALRWRHRSGVTLLAGAGGALSEGWGAPSFRGFLALALGPADPSFRAADRSRGPGGAPGADRAAVLASRPRAVAVAAPVPDPAALAASDPDPDRDGVPLPADACPDDPEDPDGVGDDDGCPDPDDDGDGVPDAADRCPAQAEVVNGVDDDDGCPDQGESRVAVQEGAIEVKERLFFEAGSDVLKEESHAVLRQVAAVLKARPGLRVRVEGHTDDVGDREANVDLSERRARSVVRFLAGEGVPPARLEAKGFGSKVPLVRDRTAEGRARNRRVEFTILPGEPGGGRP